MSVTVKFFHEIGAIFKFDMEVLKTFWKRWRFSIHLIIEQISYVGFRSLPVILFSGFFVGAILLIEFHMMLSEYDATSLLGGLSTSATIREIGPLIISFLLAGKVGAYTAAELGTMKVTEQVDAIRCLGTNPIEYLIVPRFVAIVLCSILLLIFGLMIGILGSILVGDILYNVNYLQYLQSIPRFTDGWTLFGGTFKSAVYGAIVASVSTYKGYTASGGAKGVGKAVTECAVYTNLFIVLANSFTSYLLTSFQTFVTSLLGGVG